MRQPIKAAPILIFLLFLGLAMLIGLAVPLLPMKISTIFGLMIITTLGIVIALLLPAQNAVPERTIAVLLILGIASKFLWPSFSYIPLPGLPTKNPQRLIWAICILYWVYSLMVNKTLRERLATRLAHSRTSLLVGIFFFWRFLAIFNSDYPDVSLRIYLLELFDYAPAYLFALTWLKDSIDVKRITTALVVVLIGIECMTLVEAITKSNLFLALVPIDSSSEEFLAAATETKMRAGAYRAQASFNHPLLLAQFAVTALPLVLAGILARGQSTRKSLSILAALGIPMILWATQTRTAMASAAVVIVAAGLLTAFNAATKKGQGFGRNIAGVIALLAGVLIAIAAAFLVYVLASGRTAEESGSTFARIQMLQLAMGAAADSWLFGYGPGVGGYKGALTSSNGRASLDSQMLSQLLDAGVVAMVVYALFFVQAAKRFVMLRSFVDSDSGLIQAMWCLSVFVFGFTSLVLSTPHNMPLMFFGMGVVVVLRASTKPIDQVGALLKDRILRSGFSDSAVDTQKTTRRQAT
ncbi:MAG: O-antigen ligase family protein [Burkholderiaceae bacterium]|nr:O-antigen ligase family protein [Burkholderiaceae bacterium]